MRGESRRKKKKSAKAFKTWLVEALTDLVIGIILIILEIILNKIL